MKAAALDLAGAALAGALALEKRYPAVVFTSGRRKVIDQARAMSQNIVGKRLWISQTYRATPESAALQAWVDRHPGASAPEIAAGLASIMQTWSDPQKGRLSSHFDGRAFDVQPVGGQLGADIKAFIHALPGLDRFLEQEGGLVRWHAQFH